jgi:hypothetical protein
MKSLPPTFYLNKVLMMMKMHLHKESPLLKVPPQLPKLLNQLNQLNLKPLPTLKLNQSPKEKNPLPRTTLTNNLIMQTTMVTTMKEEQVPVVPKNQPSNEHVGSDHMCYNTKLDKQTQ